MRTPKGVSWRLTEFDAESSREDSAGSLDTCSLVLDSICYTKPFDIVQAENQKSYRQCTEGFVGCVGTAASAVQRVEAPSGY